MGGATQSIMADVSPARAKSEKQLGDVSAILQKLKDEVSFLQDEVERKGAGFYVPLAAQLMRTERAINDLSVTLDHTDDGLSSKDADKIPAAVRDGVSDELTSTADDRKGAEIDLGKAIRHVQKASSVCRAAYQTAATSAKRLVEDADKLDIVVKACQTEYIKLKLLNNNAKAYVNAKRLKWQRQADCFRYWAEFVHYETIGAIQREMEDLLQEQEKRMLDLDDAMAKAQAAFEAQMSGQKCIMLLKKMKNSRMQAAFATWDEMVQMIRWERMEAEKAALMAELQARFGHMSAEEIERKMREFLKRWINRKMIGPFRSWKSIIEEKRQAEQDALLEAERARLAAQLAAMQDNVALKKLKMYFAKMLGMIKGQTFKALCVHARQQRARKMLDGEAGKRLKAFLASKLASTLRKCYTGIIRNHDNIAAENMKNNDKAKKVGLMLEKIARGLVHRCFNAFIRYFQDMAEERAAQDAIKAALAGMDEANKAKLRVFLMGKEKQKMMMFFKQWVEVTQSKGLLELYEMLDKEEAGRKAAEDELAKLLAESGDAGNALKGLEDEITHEQSELQKLVSAYKGMGGELRRLLKQIKETEGDLESEHCLRQEQQEKNYALRDELAAVTAVRDELAAELMGVAGDVSNVHEEAKFE